MDYINKIITRIEQCGVIKLDCEVDEYSRPGMKARVNGLIRKDGVWRVQIQVLGGVEAVEEITLRAYMENTKDIK